MSSILIVILLVLISCLPAALAWAYFRIKHKTPPSLLLFAMAAGFISVLLAAGAQVIIAPSVPPAANDSAARTAVLYKIFVEIALTEELARFLTLLVFSAVLRKLFDPNRAGRIRAFGLFSGFTFAAIETVFFTMTSVDSGFIRAVSAAPLHGACGIRAANAVIKLKRSPPAALLALAGAAALHGLYNFLARRGGFFPYLGAAISLTAMLTGLQSIRFEEERTAS